MMAAYTNGSGKPPDPERKTNITSLEEVRKRAEAEAKAAMRKSKASQRPRGSVRDLAIGLVLLAIAAGTVAAWVAPLFGFGR